jgi:hypothetical protein
LSDSPQRALEALSATLTPRLSAAAGEWLAAARTEIQREAASLFRLFPTTGRQVGRGRLVDPPTDGALRLFGTAGPILDPWQIPDAARAVLFLEAALAEPGPALDRVRELYEHGSGNERIAVLRSLQFFLDESAGLFCVHDALRANAIDLFAAAICENLYASHHLPDALFFQAILKCAFVGLRLDRVERVAERTTAELARMLYAYVTEREEAGRSVAAELWPLIALHPPPEAEARPEVARERAER